MDQTEHIHELGESRDMSNVYAERDGREPGEKHFMAEVELKPDVAGDVRRRRYLDGYEHKNAALAALIADPSVAEVKALQETYISERSNVFAENANKDTHAIANRIIADGLENVVFIHGGHNKPYIDTDFIAMEYDIGRQKARQVKKVLKLNNDVEARVDIEGLEQ
jgi:hypothetical protein